MSFSDWIAYLQARFEIEEGQTMAEYGIVLAVITVGVVASLGLLSGAIRGALTNVTGRL